MPCAGLQDELQAFLAEVVSAGALEKVDSLDWFKGKSTGKPFTSRPPENGGVSC